MRRTSTWRGGSCESLRRATSKCSPIDDELAHVLEHWSALRPQRATALVCDWNGSRLTTGQVRRRLYQMASKAGVTIRPHDMRHTRVEAIMRMALSNGMPAEKALDVTATLAGHRDRRTTIGYLRASMSELALVNNCAGRM